VASFGRYWPDLQESQDQCKVTNVTHLHPNKASAYADRRATAKAFLISTQVGFYWGDNCTSTYPKFSPGEKAGAITQEVYWFFLSSRGRHRL
jgi:hypothetical protein